MHSPEVPCVRRALRIAVGAVVILAIGLTAVAAELPFPPTLPGGKQVVTDRSPEFLKPTETLRSGVAIAKTPPRSISFSSRARTIRAGPGRPGATAWPRAASTTPRSATTSPRRATPWSSSTTRSTSNSASWSDLKKVLKLPEGHYVPGKIHGRLDLGGDGWLYFATHRGSTTVTADKYHY